LEEEKEKRWLIALMHSLERALLLMGFSMMKLRWYELNSTQLNSPLLAPNDVHETLDHVRCNETDLVKIVDGEKQCHLVAWGA